jgi:hypothetical protein
VEELGTSTPLLVLLGSVDCPAVWWGGGEGSGALTVPREKLE